MGGPSLGILHNIAAIWCCRGLEIIEEVLICMSVIRAGMAANVVVEGTSLSSSSLSTWLASPCLWPASLEASKLCYAIATFPCAL